MGSTEIKMTSGQCKSAIANRGAPPADQDLRAFDHHHADSHFRHRHRRRHHSLSRAFSPQYSIQNSSRHTKARSANAVNGVRRYGLKPLIHGKDVIHVVKNHSLCRTRNPALRVDLRRGERNQRAKPPSGQVEIEHHVMAFGRRGFRLERREFPLQALNRIRLGFVPSTNGLLHSQQLREHGFVVPRLQTLRHVGRHGRFQVRVRSG